MAGARVSQCSGELAGRLGGDVHRESFGFVAESCSLPGLDQRDREPAQRSSSADTKDLPLARRQDGAALGRRGTAHDRTEFSKDYGLPRPLDAEGSLGGKSNCVEEAGGVKSFQPPLTSNDERDTFTALRCHPGFTLLIFQPQPPGGAGVALLRARDWTWISAASCAAGDGEDYVNAATAGAATRF